MKQPALRNMAYLHSLGRYQNLCDDHKQAVISTIGEPPLLIKALSPHPSPTDRSRGPKT